MTILDSIALVWFLSIWVGYTLFAKRRAKVCHCLASELRAKRTRWMTQMLLRENRIPDVSIISTLERNISFFASSALLIMAGLLTAMASVEKLAVMLHQFSLSDTQTHEQIQIKLLLLVLVFVFAFFQFTWSLRQYGFGGVLIGAAPNGNKLTEDELALYANRAAKVIDQAGHSFNYGLRAIYFSLATLSWFIDAALFMAASVVVMLVMYQREFHSKVLKALIEVDKVGS
ncbi:DUF599 domain-containing protein [Aliiglaciecola sp. CAU 1673]|uniref:DUF599 domain-containing protein n=1 Tax=Aliiglaciecola sp. CAU 1673 TaxID=3032595 RepID=UPI0023DBCE60|nr:DUF599 domain-containing protein [Aliiglaciecola sp. CAU 1673]MDF2178832.1 DUF599 domain-containing protein [Aliiglaciecola sp. CAU 1673]